jgi:hypothetical protein
MGHKLRGLHRPGVQMRSDNQALVYKPQNTKFCCGARHPNPQCEDCPMREWDKLAHQQYETTGRQAELADIVAAVTAAPASPSKLRESR